MRGTRWKNGGWTMSCLMSLIVPPSLCRLRHPRGQPAAVGSSQGKNTLSPHVSPVKMIAWKTAESAPSVIDPPKAMSRLPRHQAMTPLMIRGRTKGGGYKRGTLPNHQNLVCTDDNTHQLLAPRLTHLGALGPTINSAASLKTPWLGGTGCFPNYDVGRNIHVYGT